MCIREATAPLASIGCRMRMLIHVTLLASLHQFNEKGQILGAFTSTYLLEKPRITEHMRGERNYHGLRCHCHSSNEPPTRAHAARGTRRATRTAARGLPPPRARCARPPSPSSAVACATLCARCGTITYDAVPLTPPRSVLHAVQVGLVSTRSRPHAAVEELQHMLTDRDCR